MEDPCARLRYLRASCSADDKLVTDIRHAGREAKDIFRCAAFPIVGYEATQYYCYALNADPNCILSG